MLANKILEHLNCKRQTISNELWRLQNDDSVMDRCVAFAKDGDGGIRWILGEPFVRCVPTLKHMRC